MPGVPRDALAQVKKGLRRLFSRRKKKKQPEPTPSSNTPTQTPTAATAAAPVEAPATSNRSVTEADDAPKNQEPPHPPPPPAADPASTTAAPSTPDFPLATTAAATSSEQPTSERQPHISAPAQIEEAKEIDVNPAREMETQEGGITTAASDVKTGLRAEGKPRRENETGMSATSGPMGDHMAEVWRDSDVGVKEGRPVEVEGKARGIAEGAEGEGEGGEF